MPAATAPEPALDQDDSAADPKGGSSVSGLSGLSEIMQAEPAELPASLAGSGPRPVREAKIIKTMPRQRPRAAAGPSAKRRAAILIAAVFALIVALAGLALLLLPPGNDPAGPPPGTTSGLEDTPETSSNDAADEKRLPLGSPPAPIKIEAGADGRPTAQQP